MTCQNICFRYKVKKPQKNIGRYESGQKRCPTCEIFISWEGIQCPCCGGPLRQKPRNSKSRKKIMNIQLAS